MEKLGKHCFAELYGCPYELLNDEKFLLAKIVDAINKTELTLLDISAHKFQPQGVTIVALLSESHISIHTWPETGSAALDVFTCGQNNPEIAMQYMVKELKAQDHCTHCMER
tara:strand:+ start:670 stop:1005 length:336 start_codon:yes stop_codon:yes gene_type:complete